METLQRKFNKGILKNNQYSLGTFILQFKMNRLLKFVCVNFKKLYLFIQSCVQVK